MRFLIMPLLVAGLLSGTNKLAPQDRGIRLTAFSQQPRDSFPIPEGINNQLFYLQRNHNLNTIVCQMNVKNMGEPDPEDPVHVFWIRYSDKGEKAELSFIQRTFAYGIRAHAIHKNEYELHFAGYKKYSMYLRKSVKDRKYHVYARIEGRDAILERIFIKINGGSFWSPNVEYVELKGIDVDSSKEIVQRLKI